uniref:Ubiquitin-like domain-containing protein n=1 Tax=Panagrellus redivivus TaxID=6233 RepID=A0A7E4VYQ1_PANRE
MAATDSISALSISEYSEAPSEADVTMAHRSLSQILSDLDVQLKTAVTPTGSSYSTKTAIGITNSDYSLHTAKGSSRSRSLTAALSCESIHSGESETETEAVKVKPIDETPDKNVDAVKVEKQENVVDFERPKQSVSNVSVNTGVSNLVGSSDSEYSIISEPELDLGSKTKALNVIETDSTDDDLVTCISNVEDQIKVIAKPTEITIDETRVEFENGNQFIEIFGKLNQVEPFKLDIELEPIDHFEDLNESFSSTLTFSISEIDYTHTCNSIDDEDYVVASSETSSEQSVFSEMSDDLPELTPQATHACLFIKNVHEVIDEANVINNLTQETMANIDQEPEQVERHDFYSVTFRFLQIPINFASNIAYSVIRFNLFFFKLPFVPIRLIYGGMIMLYDSITSYGKLTGTSESDFESESESDSSDRLTTLTEEEEQKLRALEQEYLKTRQATFSFSEYSNPDDEHIVDPEGTMQLQASTSMAAVFHTVTAANESDNTDHV